jgi:hypothetical protein
MPAVNGVGKPCAGEPHARFDGRELETEQRLDQGHGDEGHQGKPCGHQRLRDLPSIVVTAPALDPTWVALSRCRRGRKCAEMPLKADRDRLDAPRQSPEGFVSASSPKGSAPGQQPS